MIGQWRQLSLRTVSACEYEVPTDILCQELRMLDDGSRHTVTFSVPIPVEEFEACKNIIVPLRMPRNRTFTIQACQQEAYY
jgi:hypothetical protein